MSNWYFYSIAALLLLGTQRFLYKVAAERNCRTPLTTAVFMGTVTLLSGTVFVVSAEPVGNLRALVVLAFVNSAAFALTTIANMEALRHLPAGITFPLTRLSLVVVIVVSLVCFHERLVSSQWLGILAGLAVVAVLAGEADKAVHPGGNPRRGFGFVALCIVCGAIASISSKLAAVSTSKSGFMALSYFLATLFALAIEKKWGGGKVGDRPGDAIRIGILMGVLNFFGFYAFLAALAVGPLSVIALITGMHFVITIGLSVLLYREKMTLRRGIGIALTLLAVFFLKH